MYCVYHTVSKWFFIWFNQLPNFFDQKSKGLTTKTCQYNGGHTILQYRLFIIIDDLQFKEILKDTDTKYFLFLYNAFFTEFAILQIQTIYDWVYSFIL